MIGVRNNFNTLAAMRALNAHQRAIATATTRLATGKRINRAADDPAGMAAATKLSQRRVSLDQIIQQADQGAALLDTADAGLAQLDNLLTDLNALIVQTANAPGPRSPDELKAAQTQADSILDAIDHVIQNTTFNKKKILVEGASFQAGDTFIAVPSLQGDRLGTVWVENPAPPPPEHFDPQNPTPRPHSAFSQLDLHDLGAGKALNLVDGDHEQAQRAVDAARQSVDRIRASVGSLRRYTLGAEVDADRTELENTAAAQSQIEDTDYAVETATLIREQTLAQASISVIQMAQRSEQNALALLA